VRTPQRILISQEKREWTSAGFKEHGSVLVLADHGSEAKRIEEIGHPVAMASSSAGHVLLREVSIFPFDRQESVRRDRVMAPTGELSTPFSIGRYSYFNHYFPILGSEAMLALHGSGTHHHQDKGIYRVDPGSLQATRLFPLEWNEERNAHLMSHGACFAPTRSGDTIVTATSVHHRNALDPTEGLLTSRRFPDGTAIWERPIDAKTAWVGYVRSKGLVVAALADGRLLLLDDMTGAIEYEESITERGTVQVILSGATDGSTLALGTRDGSILVYEVRRDRVRAREG